ncbi:hypothetical protein PJW08_06650 [Tenacibaculum finnmarkense]|nr:hypothetical protein PJW08_06640 [Tenacibaculum finnmarkense]WCC45708.1 hypothetical protein PJW08_06650 [Tenacibaculum finnmarkense]
MVLVPSQVPAFSTSVKVAFNPVEQLSASSETTPVFPTDTSKTQFASVEIVISFGAVNIGFIVSSTVIIWSFSG